MKVIEDFIPFEGECYANGKYKWLQEDIVKLSKKCKPFKLPLHHIDTDVKRWKDTETINDFAWHMKRSLSADMKYPVIMDNRGSILNGWHRIAYALATDKKYIMCVRLEEDLPTNKRIKNTPTTGVEG